MTRALPFALAATLLAGAAAAEEIKLTVVAGHPPATAGVQNMRDFFIPEVDKRLASAGGKHKIAWTQAYAGSVAKPTEVLETVENGIGDVGYLPALFEADKLPLEQITYVTPFGTGDLPKLMAVIRNLREAIPEMRQQYVKHKQVHLANVGVDTYHVMSTFPVNSIDDFKGRKFGTAGLASRWLEGSGWVPVKGDLPTYYNSLQTGVYEGIITFESAVAGYKFHEVAPHITKVDFGAQFATVVTMNQRRWERLPKEVQDVFRAVSSDYEAKVAEVYQTAGEKSLTIAQQNGAKIVNLPEAERKRLAAMLPNLAKEWAAQIDKKNLPGTKTLATYMELSRKAGIHHARAWDKE